MEPAKPGVKPAAPLPPAPPVPIAPPPVQAPAPLTPVKHEGAAKKKAPQPGEDRHYQATARKIEDGHVPPLLAWTCQQCGRGHTTRLQGPQRCTCGALHTVELPT